MTTASKSIDTYLASVPETHRAALMKLRNQIKRLCPKATEHIRTIVTDFGATGEKLR
jgi:uncharacterized protein YdhG (YjbR/CyaY superfamily)